MNKLSNVETEMLREMKSRLGRPAISPQAALTLGGAFLKVCERVEIGPVEGAPVPEVSPAALVKFTETADMAGLKRVTSALLAIKDKDPKRWPAVLEARLPQAVLNRRLALGGRGQPAGEGV
jgi:hypothetical protein